ncbi:protein RSI-1 [Apium graveolens]|uniref:protein RSI-1 n=1 Tax=Apium graveolens TaxID=4045 RepID=UPI003D79835C
MAAGRDLLLVSLLFLVASFNIVEGYNRLRRGDCKPRCSYRCSATSHRKPCMFFCQKCCAKCLCVPPGTYGNKQTCPCYNRWKTQQGAPKCP